jgi:hypothetical protein
MSRPKYHDLTPGDFGEQLAPYDFVELKYDGLYGDGVFGAGGWAVTGRNGAMLRYGYNDCQELYFRGEMIEGTEWAAQSPLHGAFACWDCVYSGEQAPASYQQGRAMMANAIPSVALATGARIVMSESWPICDAEGMWHDFKGYEGLIFRSADGQRYGRMKRVVTMDYVVTGVKRQGPRITALYGGLWIDGQLETVCTVPVRSAREQAALVKAWPPGEMIGLVFEAKGNAVFKSGALRNPRQADEGGAVKWRPDKRAEECKL